MSGDATEGQITSPGFPNTTYNNNEQCVWQFLNQANINSSIALRFTVFHVETHGECIYDFVEIREG